MLTLAIQTQKKVKQPGTKLHFANCNIVQNALSSKTPYISRATADWTAKRNCKLEINTGILMMLHIRKNTFTI